MPVKASVKLMSIFITRSDPFLLYREWAFSSSTMMMSPGSSPGSWSPSPLKVTFWPSSIPLSTDTSRIFLSRLTFLPLHFLQRSLGSTLSVTFLAHALDLLHHPRPQLLDPDLHPSTPAVRALLHSSCLATDTIASITNHILLKCKLPDCPVVHVFQRH